MFDSHDDNMQIYSGFLVPGYQCAKIGCIVFHEYAKYVGIESKLDYQKSQKRKTPSILAALSSPLGSAEMEETPEKYSVGLSDTDFILSELQFQDSRFTEAKYAVIIDRPNIGKAYDIIRNNTWDERDFSIIPYNTDFILLLRTINPQAVLFKQAFV